MSADDKISLRLILIWLALCALWGGLTQQPSLGLILAAPAGVILLIGWMNRAYSISWLAQRDVDKLVYRRPFVLRAFNGVSALLFLLLAALFVVLQVPPVLAWTGGLFFLLLCGICLSMTAPSTVMFDLTRQEYMRAWGFAPFQHLLRGSTEGGAVFFNTSARGPDLLYFRPVNEGKWGFFVADCSARGQADTQARELADALGVPFARLGQNP